MSKSKKKSYINLISEVDGDIGFISPKKFSLNCSAANIGVWLKTVSK